MTRWLLRQRGGGSRSQFVVAGDFHHGPGSGVPCTSAECRLPGAVRSFDMHNQVPGEMGVLDRAETQIVM